MEKSIMRNRVKKQEKEARSNVVINIHGGNNQILPNVTEVVQNFYGAELDRTQEQQPGGREEEEESEAVRIARGTLCIYYSDEWKLRDIIRRIAECRSAADLANLVVNEMCKHTILTSDRMVSKDFIEALQQFLTFKSGTSTGNIRTQINNVRRESERR